jgi:aminopeptidase-like protein
MRESVDTPSADQAGEAMHALVAELYPICRSITGEGVRRTLEIVQRYVPIEVKEVPSGTKVLDWEIPPEWNIREAYVRDPSGRRVIDLADHNLHLVGYSEPVRRTMPLSSLRPHLHSLPERPDWIPYRTSYYRRDWGFCLAHRALEALADGEYEVVIDSSLEPGRFCWGELLIPGDSPEEVLLSAHICHPSLANDNLSGIAVLAFLARDLLARSRRWLSVRVLMAPATIGAIAWLALNEQATRRIRHGMVLSCLGDGAPLHWKRTRRGDAVIDRAVVHILAAGDEQIAAFSPYGYDERQYNSPGFDLPVGLLTRGVYGKFPEYHTSGDDLELVRPSFLADSLQAVLRVMAVLEGNKRYLNMSPKGEPQLGRRGLFSSVGGRTSPRELELAMLWVLNLSDGHHDLLAVAERSGLDFSAVRDAADRLLTVGLLRDLEDGWR